MKVIRGWVWWHMLLVTSFGRQRQVDSESEARLVYRVSSRSSESYIVRSCLKTKQSKNSQTQPQTQNRRVAGEIHFSAISVRFDPQNRPKPMKES